jgi:hypothetical protein
MAALEKPHAPVASNTSDADVEVPGSINEKKLLRTLDLRLLPAVSVLYLLSFLDRSNGTASPPPYSDVPLTCHSRERSDRRPNDRPPHDRQPVPYGLDSLLPRLRPLRNPMQHCAQANDAEVLAADIDTGMGSRCDTNGHHEEFIRLLRCAVLVGVQNGDDSDLWVTG